MSFKRWLPTFLGFPLGGLLAIQTVGSIHSPLSAAVAGALAGAVIGGAQWLALRSSDVRALWIAAMALATAIGMCSKESAIVAVAAVALYDFIFARGAEWRARSFSSDIFVPRAFIRPIGDRHGSGHREISTEERSFLREQFYR